MEAVVQQHPMCVWEDAVFAFDRILDEYDAGVTAILATLDPLCLAMFKRSLARARKRGKQKIEQALWRQSKEKHSGYVLSRNAHGKKHGPKTREDKVTEREKRRKRGVGAHKRGPRTLYTYGKRVGHHRKQGQQYVY